MKLKRFSFLLLTPLIVLTLSTHCGAVVEWDILSTFKVAKAPVDVAVSRDGRLVYILTDGGTIHIYSTEGTLKDKISMGKSVDRIIIGPREDLLFVSSSQDKTVQLVMVGFVQHIDVTGSPFKGPAGAKVVISVFSDFQ